MPGQVFHELFELWRERRGQDEYLGTLVNAWLAGGGRARGVRAGKAYVDVGTLHGYREAMQLLGARPDFGKCAAASKPTYEAVLDRGENVLLHAGRNGNPPH